MQDKIRSLNKVLVIDEIPVICLGLQEAFIATNKEITVEYTESIFQAASSPSYDNKVFDLIIAGTPDDDHAPFFIPALSDLKARFPMAKVMLFAENYDPSIIEKMQDLGISAYVHKYESIEEIKQVYEKVSNNESYISTIFHTIYFKYGVNPALLQEKEDQLLSVSTLQREILLLLCQGKTAKEIALAMKRPTEEITDQLNLFSAKL